MVAPVPLAHLSFIDATAVLRRPSPFSSPTAFALAVLEHDDLRVLPAELDDAADVGVQVLDRERDRVHLLDELAAGRRAERRRAGARQEDPPVAGPADPGRPPRIVSSIASTYSGCFVWWRW